MDNRVVTKSISEIISIDICKFILSILIVAIHVSPFSREVRAATLPILRIAVPLFFLFSSYFLFGKIASCETKAQRVRALYRYIVRTAILYVFWYIVLFFPTLAYRWDTYQAWFSEGLFSGGLHYITSILFSSTFKASWYLSASIIGAIVAYLLNDRKKLSILVASLCFLFCCASSNYYGAMPDSIAALIGICSKLGSPYNSFPAAISWMMLGRELSYYLTPDNISKYNHRSASLVLLSLIGVATLYLERSSIVISGISKADDCYISLPAVVVPLFLLTVCQREYRGPAINAAYLRMSSTITYCTHATLGFTLPVIFPNLTGYMLFIVVIVICQLITMIIYLAEHKLNIALLKYSH